MYVHKDSSHRLYCLCPCKKSIHIHRVYFQCRTNTSTHFSHGIPVMCLLYCVLHHIKCDVKCDFSTINTDFAFSIRLKKTKKKTLVKTKNSQSWWGSNFVFQVRFVLEIKVGKMPANHLNVDMWTNSSILYEKYTDCPLHLLKMNIWTRKTTAKASLIFLCFTALESLSHLQ